MINDIRIEVPDGSSKSMIPPPIDEIASKTNPTTAILIPRGIFMIDQSMTRFRPAVLPASFPMPAE